MKLRLAAGDGPVYLTGTHSQEIEEEMESESNFLQILSFDENYFPWVLIMTNVQLMHGRNSLYKVECQT